MSAFIKAEVSLEECKALPKVELHAHLNGSLSLKTIEKLRKLHQTEGKFDHSTILLTQPTTMAEVFKIFPIIQSLMVTMEAVKMGTEDVIREFAEDGVRYLELRSTPKSTAQMSKEQYVQAIIDGIESCSAACNICVRLLLSIDRRQSIEEAEDTVNLAIKFKKSSSYVVGIDLSGDPAFNGRKMIPTLKKAKENGLPVTVHIAEMREHTSEVTDLLAFLPDRLGHGSFLHEDAFVTDFVIQHKIPLEICLTSNLMSATTASVEESHIKFWIQRDIPIALCTDDKGLMNCDLSHEFHLASTTFGFNLDDLRKISRQSLEMSFLPRNSKEYKELEKLFA